MKFLILSDDIPEEVEAKSLEEAEKIVMDNISIRECDDDWCEL